MLSSIRSCTRRSSSSVIRCYIAWWTKMLLRSPMVSSWLRKEAYLRYAKPSSVSHSVRQSFFPMQDLHRHAPARELINGMMSQSKSEQLSIGGYSPRPQVPALPPIDTNSAKTDGKRMGNDQESSWVLGLGLWGRAAKLTRNSDPSQIPPVQPIELERVRWIYPGRWDLAYTSVRVEAEVVAPPIATNSHIRRSKESSEIRRSKSFKGSMKRI